MAKEKRTQEWICPRHIPIICMKATTKNKLKRLNELLEKKWQSEQELLKLLK